MSNLILPWNSEYEDYLRDESRCVGVADSISFPRNEAEVITVVKAVQAEGKSLTTQGARTGITAAAVPQGGHVLNMSRMNAIGEIRRTAHGGVLTVQPGVLLQDIVQAVNAEGLFFPPDPTETSASIGGMVACNASGAMTFRYGPTRRWVNSLRVVLSDGDTLTLTRGGQQAQGRAFSLVTDGGRTIAGALPRYTPPAVKSAAGYYVDDDLELIDLFIGMEGTLGIITEIELLLMPKPAAVMALTAFLPSEEAALTFVKLLRGNTPAGRQQPVAIEFFNHDALNLLRRMKTESAAFEKIPALNPNFHTAVYVEYHGESDEELEGAMMQALEEIEMLGGSGDDTWAATNMHELATLKAFRHAIPEAVNLLIGQRKQTIPTLTKLGTDMSVPDTALETTMTLYHDTLRAAGLESVIFGHIGNNHVHVNILPNSLEEYDRGKKLYFNWAQYVVGCGGSVSAEHGIGKLKLPFLKLMYGGEGIVEMRAVKALFDPAGTLNPGTLFAEER